VLLLLFTSAQSAYSQGLACNSGVNVSLDQNCTAVINARHILKGEAPDADPLLYEVLIKNMDGSIPDSLDVEFSNTAISSTNPVMAAAFAATFQYGNRGSYVRFKGIGRYKVSIIRKSDGVPCWGDLLIEDKLPPFTTECFCPDDIPYAPSDTLYPKDCVFSCATVTDFMNNDSIAKLAGVNPVFEDHCGNNANVEFHDELTQDTTCGNWIIIRTWRTLVSYHGKLEYKNLNCTQKFVFRSFGTDAIFPPKKKLVITCGIDTDPESLRNHFSNTTLFPGANPDSATACVYPYLVDNINDSLSLIHSIGQGLTPGTHDDLCKITATYTDTNPNRICGDIGYKFVRSWHVIDWCTNESLPEMHQVIKVVDEEAPEFTIPDSIPLGMTDPWTCKGGIMIPPPDTLYDNCSSLSQLTWLAYILDGANRIEANSTNNYKLNNVSPGTYTLTYVVRDLCNNETVKQTQLVVKDEVAPVALSKYEIKITFTSHLGNCTAKVFPHSIDAGSFDACSEIVKYEIRRKNSTDPFADFVKFNQGDINSINPAGVAFGVVNIEMRVMDAFGNSNLAWTKVTLEDKNTRIVTDCGVRRVSLTCKDDLDAAIVQYAPTAIIKACVDSTLTPMATKRSSNIDSRCNTGTVIVDYKLPGSQDTICSKTFILGDLDSMNIRWPQETIEVTCTQSDFGEVIITGKDCNLIAPTEKIREVDVPGSGYCKKLIREITVIDWCRYQVNQGDTIGIYRYNQVIKVKDDQAPSIVCQSVELSAGNDCTISGFQIEAQGSDASTCDNETIVWAAAIDTDGNGSYDLDLNPVASTDGGVMAVVNSPLSVGVYKVRWSATDACHNRDYEICTITITDGKAPTPQCISTVSTALMNTSGTVGIWAKDFDLDGKSSDCGGTLTYSFSGTDPNVPSKTYTCADLLDGISVIDTFRVYVWDAAGNNDFCTVMLMIRDNSDYCPNTDGQSSIISGQIATAFGTSLESAEVSIKSMQTEATDYKMTDVEGSYAFNSEMSGDYMISAEKNDDYLNGISTADIILIQRHILSIKSFEDPHQTIAADVSGDERVTSLDLVELRKLILGRSIEFSGKKSWRFVSKNQQISDAREPWPLDENVMIDHLDYNQLNNDFVAIKLGDVNGNAIANSAILSGGRSKNSEVILIADRKVSKGEEVVLAMDLSNLKALYGLQLSMKLEGGTWLNASSSQLNLNDSHLFITSDHLRMSWSEVSEVSDGGIMSVSFVANESGLLSDMISMESEDIPAMSFSGADLEPTDLLLSWTTTSDDLNAEFELYQNVPNPFDGETSIGFRISKRGVVELAVFDMTGRQVMGKTGTYDAGYNTITVDQSQLNQGGVLYYQLSYDNKIATRKMLSLE